MSEDIIRLRIWNGLLKVEVLLAEDETSTTVPSYFLDVHRNSYFPFYYEQFALYFGPYIAGFGEVKKESDEEEKLRGILEKTSQISKEKQRTVTDFWLSFEDVPLKWNYPVGLLYDYMIGLLEEARLQRWKLILHTQNYPKEFLLPMQSLQAVETYWVNQIKESCYVQNSSAKKVLNLSREDSLRLWEYTQKRDYAQLKQIYFGKVVPKRPAELKRIPLKIYLPYLERNVVIQEPISPFEEDGHTLITLRKVLHKCLPDLFSSDAATTNKASTDRLGKALIQGVNVELDVPLCELYYLMMYLDGFLHICVAIDI